MIAINNLQKNYDDFQLNCSLKISPGTITGVIGPNGAGKSTLFKVILGLTSIDAGSVSIFGKEVHSLTAEDRQQIGVTLSDSGFSGYLTIRGISSILDNLYPKFNKNEFLEKCTAFQLPLKKQVKNFSTGMKAKLKVLIALSHDTSLLILDEPTAGLDVNTREDILDMLRDYMEANEDRTILISSHISSDLEELCDDFYFINNGEIILHEETDTLLSNYSILKVSVEEYISMDKNYLLYYQNDVFGYRCLTNERQFYLENYPGIIAEKGNIDDLILMTTRGEKL